MEHGSLALQYLLSGITKGSIYAIVAIGFNLIYSATGIINFAQGEFVMLGGMVAVTLALYVPLPVAVKENTIVAPAAFVWLCGCITIAGGFVPESVPAGIEKSFITAMCWALVESPNCTGGTSLKGV